VVIVIDGGGYVFETLMGGTREEQDGKDGDRCDDQDTEEERREKSHQSSDG